MAKRFRVIRRAIVWKRQEYDVGTLMPPNFTERDRIRHLYSRRFEEVEVPDEPAGGSTGNPVVPPANSGGEESTSPGGGSQQPEIKPDTNAEGTQPPADDKGGLLDQEPKKDEQPPVTQPEVKQVTAQAEIKIVTPVNPAAPAPKPVQTTQPVQQIKK